MSKRFLAAVSALLFAGAVAAEPVGTPVSVNAPAQLTRAGETVALAVGSEVQVGDIVQTGATGQVQLRFFDDTRIAIGPNANFVISEISGRDGSTAGNFVVGAVRGAFRFLSGNSPQSAYSVRTPTATLGIRGTIFDVSVANQQSTDVVLHEGEVRICSNRGGCAVMIGSCAYVSAPGAGGFETVQDRQTFTAILGERFPFVASQASLRADFRAPVENCGRVNLPVIRDSSETTEAPALPPPPPPPPPQEGEGFIPPGQGGGQPGSGNPTPGQGGTPPGQQNNPPQGPNAPSGGPEDDEPAGNPDNSGPGAGFTPPGRGGGAPGAGNPTPGHGGTPPGQQ